MICKSFGGVEKSFKRSMTQNQRYQWKLLFKKLFDFHGSFSTERNTRGKQWSICFMFCCSFFTKISKIRLNKEKSVVKLGIWHEICSGHHEKSEDMSFESSGKYCLFFFSTLSPFVKSPFSIEFNSQGKWKFRIENRAKPISKSYETKAWCQVEKVRFELCVKIESNVENLIVEGKRCQK